MHRALLAIALIFLVICSCGPKAAKKTENPGDLYVQGVEFMKIKKYDKAIERFSKIRENYPFDPIADVAVVKLGDAYFEKKVYVMAAGVYEDFFTSHPDDENVPYVLKRLGESYMRQAPLVERDQTVVMKAIERFTFLKNRYPASQYAKDADTQMAALNQKLADRELYVGEWYHKTGQYNAAILRLEYLLSKYPDSKGKDRVLYYLADSFKELNDMEKSQHYMDRLKKEYPKSVFALATVRERASLRVARPERQSQPEASTPAPLGYAEKRKKEIDLRPPEQTTERDAKSPVLAEPSKEEGEAPRTPAQEEKKPGGEKKGPLGFFTEKKPVDVVSDTMEGLEKGKIVVFKGHVIAKQGEMSMFCDTLTAYLSEETNEIERAHAEGNVKIVKQERTATCEEAFFDNAKGEIILKRNAVVFSGADKVAGDTVTYFLNDDRVHVQGEKEKRARVTVTPK